MKVTGDIVEPHATQAANWSPDTTNRYMPSVAVDSAGNMAIGYTTSGSSLFPALKYAGHRSTDAVNTMGLTEQTLFQGTGGQLDSMRWGDYSAMTLDPDGCTFWYTNEYYATTGDDWHTRIGSFKFPQCTSNYSTFLGGGNYDYGYGIAVDASGHAYVTGRTNSTDFPTKNQFQTGQGGNDAFVTKLDTNAVGAASLLYSTCLGSRDDAAFDIAVDASGHAYVTGYTFSAYFPTLDALQTYQGYYDVFVTELDTNASGTASLLYSTYLGGYWSESGRSIAVDAAGNVYVTGETLSADFPTVNQYRGFDGFFDAFVTKLPNTALISGRMTSDGTTGLSGVTITVSGSMPSTTVTDSDGNYSIKVATDGNYTVTPSKDNVTFIPSEQSFTNLQADQTGVDFTGTLGTISGRVTSDGTTGIGGVNVTLSGSQTGIVVTDSTGNYTFTDLAGGGNYTVTPSKGDLIFAPSERSFINLQANQMNVNFTTQLATISGRVTTGTGAALAGVTVALTNATLSLNTTTASDGTYSFSNLPTLANYKVKPTLTGYTFSPSDIVLYSLSANQPDVNFIGSTNYTTQTSTISGRVTIATPTGVVLAGVTVTLTSGPDLTLSTTTASDGTYSFSNLATRDTYTLTPSRTNYTFSPTQIALNNLKTNQANANFIAKLKTYAVSGVVKLGTAGLSDVTVTLTSQTPAGFAPRTATTDSNGAYSLNNVPAERDYTVTPQKSGYQFTPVSKSFTNLSANQTAINFSVVFYSITGQITRTGTTTAISGVTVTITSPVPANFAARTVQTGPQGNYQFTILPGGRDYTIEPTKAGFTFTPTTRTITNLSSNIAAGASTNFTGTGP